MDGKNDFSETVPLAYSVFDFEAEKQDNLLPVVIVHALLSSRKTWEYIATKLARQTGRVVYTVDLRNHGDSPHHEDGHMWNHYQKDLELFLQSRGITKCHFIGHSLGGKLQLHLSFSKPELVGSLIIVDLLPIPSPELIYTYTTNTTNALRNCLAELKDIDVQDLQQAKKFCELELKDKISSKSLRETVIQDLKTTDDGYDWKFNNDNLENHSHTMIEFDTTDQVFKGPTLVIAPELSYFVTTENLTKVADILPNMRCVQLPNVSHQLHMETPEKVVNLCVEFWSTI